MFQQQSNQFIYGGQRFEVKDFLFSNIYSVKLYIGDRSENVEPMETGFLTGPQSSISKILGKQGCTLIKANCTAQYAERKRRYRLMRDTHQMKMWLTNNGASQGGILFGEIQPRKARGWYIVLMMQVGRYGGYIDYAEPGYQYVGASNPLCEQIRKERGVDGIYNNGVEHFVTTISGQEVKSILKL